MMRRGKAWQSSPLQEEPALLQSSRSEGSLIGASYGPSNLGNSFAMTISLCYSDFSPQFIWSVCLQLWL